MEKGKIRNGVEEGKGEDGEEEGGEGGIVEIQPSHCEDITALDSTDSRQVTHYHLEQL